MINKITDDFEKVVIKRIKTICQKLLPNYKKWTTQNKKKKPIKIGKQSGTTYCFGGKDCT